MSGVAGRMNILGDTHLYRAAYRHFPESPATYRRGLAIYALLFAPAVLGDFASCSVASLPASLAGMLPQLYYIALVFAAACFGIAGGLIAAGIAAASHLMISAIACGSASPQGGPLIMFAAVGFMAGWLGERRDRGSVRPGHHGIPSEGERSANVSLSQLGQLMPDLVHQFRTPIASIEGAGFVLQDSDLSGDRRQELAGIIRKECGRLELMVDLLDFTQTRSSGHKTIDVKNLLEEVIESCEAIADEHIAFQNAVRSDMPRLRCEPELIKHALQVLMTISMEAISQDGQIEVSSNFGPRDVVITLNARAEQFSSQIGSGMPSGRNAIDLAVVQSIVSRHGGSVHLEPLAGAGLSIVMTLPREPWMGV